MNHTRIGIILPSGGCKCAFQAGVLKAIEKLIPAEHIHYLQGVSGGILNGAKFISDDSKADGLIELWKEVEEMGVGRLFDLCTVVLNQIGKNKPFAANTVVLLRNGFCLDSRCRSKNTCGQHDAEHCGRKEVAKQRHNQDKYITKRKAAPTSRFSLFPFHSTRTSAQQHVPLVQWCSLCPPVRRVRRQ